MGACYKTLDTMLGNIIDSAVAALHVMSMCMDALRSTVIAELPAVAMPAFRPLFASDAERACCRHQCGDSSQQQFELCRNACPVPIGLLIAGNAVCAFPCLRHAR